MDNPRVEHFLTKSGQRLRMGFTTGSAAALAARAAVRMLLTGREEAESSLVTPKGIPLTVPLREVVIDEGEAGCSVRKDAGDDPDVTDGILVRATVRRAIGRGVRIDGGEGVGRVTKPGLDQPVGAAAITRVPRMMIEREARSVCEELGYDGGISVIISIPGGEEIAARTFNPNLGIVGGLSVIGTSGMVEPMSTRAIVETIRAEMSVVRAQGADALVLTPGNYGEAFVGTMPAVARKPQVKCSNFIGEALDIAKDLRFSRVLIVGHIGKLVKLSGGIMDTHSRVADCRMELLALHAALAGAEAACLRRVLQAVAVDDGLEALGSLRGAVIAGVVGRAEDYCRRRTAGNPAVGLLFFSNRLGLLGVSREGESMLASWEKSVG